MFQFIGKGALGKYKPGGMNRCNGFILLLISTTRVTRGSETTTPATNNVTRPSAVPCVTCHAINVTNSSHVEPVDQVAVVAAVVVPLVCSFILAVVVGFLLWRRKKMKEKSPSSLGRSDQKTPKSLMNPGYARGKCMENVLYESSGNDVLYCEPFKHEQYKRAKQESAPKATENPLYEPAAPCVNVKVKPAIFTKPQWLASQQ